MGSKNTLDRLFAGRILRDTHGYTGTPANGHDAVHIIDHTWDLTRGTITQRWTYTSMTVIAQAIIAHAGRGFTAVGVEAGLPVLEEFTVTDRTHAQALGALCRRLDGCSWKPSYHKDIRLGVSPEASQTDPTDLTPASALVTGMTGFQVTRDLGPAINQQPVEGGGVNALADVPVGETTLPVQNVGWYTPSGGTVACGPQLLTYTGLHDGGTGALVGPGVSPSAAPSLTLAAGAGVESGEHEYVYTWVTAAGETLPSPLGSVTTGSVAAPATTPTIGTPTTAFAGADGGSHDYEATFVTALGETTPSPISAAAVVTFALAAPTAAPTHVGWATGSLDANANYKYAVTNVNAVGETLPGPLLADFTFGAFTAIQISVPLGPQGTTSRKVYRTVGGGAQLKLLTTIANNTSTFLATDGLADGSLGANAPTSSTATSGGAGSVPLTALPIGGAMVTSRKLYRRFNGAGTFKLVTTIANNTATTYLDTVPNASLGADAPVANTAGGNQVALSGIAVGPATTTQRKVYRTAAGLSQLKLQQTIANNTDTVGVTDATADASLGANVPTGDTSGLTQPSGQVNPGSTTLIVSSTAFASATGGYAIIGNGTVIRYTGTSGGTLTGIPATGVWAIPAAVTYNSTVTAAPALLGIPASGDGSIRYAIKAGDPVNLRVVVEDLPAQATIAALLGGGDDGIIVGDLIQDNRLSETEARARGSPRSPSGS